MPDCLVRLTANFLQLFLLCQRRSCQHVSHWMLRWPLRLCSTTSALTINLMDCREDLDKELQQAYPEAFNAYSNLTAVSPLPAPTDSSEQPKQ